MTRAKFPLSSDQLELLLAFEECEGLLRLSEVMAKDPSVISRGLQKIAEEQPVLLKVKGRWELTPLGRQTNALTLETIDRYKNLIPQKSQSRSNPRELLSGRSLLIVINAQCGLLDATQAGRNNSEAEKNIESLLKVWRSRKMPVLHVRHVSEDPSSIFYLNGPGVEFLPQTFPVPGEMIIDKKGSSSFSSTNLKSHLEQLHPSHLVLAGFTANECIDATARDSSTLGFSTFVVGDATAMFDMKDAFGKWLKAERVHRLTLANIHALYARVITTQELL